MRYYKMKKIWILVFAGFGLVAGVLFINCLGDTYSREIIWRTDTLRLIQEMNVDQRMFFWQLLKKRGSIVLGIWLCGYTFLGFPILVLWFGWLGFVLGVFLTSAVVQMRLTGILIGFSAVFPQILFYIPAMCALVDEVMERKTEEKKKGGILTMATCIIAAVVLESTVNPVLFRWVIKNFYKIS